MFIDLLQAFHMQASNIFVMVFCINLLYTARYNVNHLKAFHFICCNLANKNI